MSAQQQNAILLPRAAPLMRPLVLANGATAYSQDASVLPFMVEDLIRFSAVDLAIDAHSMYYAAVDRLPAQFKNRVRRVDVDRVAIEKTKYVLEPVWQECGFDFSPSSVVSHTDREKDLGPALLTLTGEVELLIIGCDHRLQVDVSPERALSALSLVSGEVHDGENRATLATLEGIFRSYGPREVPSLVARSHSPEELGRRFQEFVEDETYRRMAQEATLLGVPARATHAVLRMRRAAVSLLAKPRFKAAGDLTSRTVGTSSGFAVPTTGPLQTVLEGRRYLAPLISLEETTSRAVATWTEVAPPFIPVDSDADLDGARVLPPRPIAQIAAELPQHSIAEAGDHLPSGTDHHRGKG